MTDPNPPTDPPSEAASPEPEEERRAGFPLRSVLTFVAAWLGGSWLVVGLWFHALFPGGWWGVAAGFALMPIPVWRLIRGFQGVAYPSKASRLFLFRPFWYAMLLLPPVAVGILVGGIVGLPFGVGGSLGRWSVAITGPLLGFIAFAGYRDSRRLVMRRLEVRMPRLPENFDGLRVAQISDLHVGPHTSRAFLARVANAVRDEKPDLILHTGDQVDDFAEDVVPFNAALGELRSPLGVFAVLGNHEIYAGWRAVRGGLERGGMTVLVNEAVALERDGQRLWIAGTGDPAASGGLRGDPEAAPDIVRTLAAVPENEAVLVMAHNPVLWPALVERGADLTLSGHTHYGQFVMPGLRWCLASPFLKLAMGMHRQGRSLLSIHPGTNFWGIPLRFGTPPEIALLTLRCRREGEAEILPSVPVA